MASSGIAMTLASHSAGSVRRRATTHAWGSAGPDPAQLTGMRPRHFTLRPTKFDTLCVPAGRIMFECQPMMVQSEAPMSEHQDLLVTSKLERLAEELRALGIDF